MGLCCISLSGAKFSRYCLLADPAESPMQRAAASSYMSPPDQQELLPAVSSLCDIISSSKTSMDSLAERNPGCRIILPSGAKPRLQNHPA